MSRYEEIEHKRDAVMEQFDRIMIRRRKIERFIESVKDQPELITEFDESLWAGLVDSMTVYAKDRIVFRLTCGWRLKCKTIAGTAAHLCGGPLFSTKLERFYLLKTRYLWYTPSR